MQQINFVGRLEKNEVITMFFIIEKLEETTLTMHKIGNTKKL